MSYVKVTSQGTLFVGITAKYLLCLKESNPRTSLFSFRTSLVYLPAVEGLSSNTHLFSLVLHMPDRLIRAVKLTDEACLLSGPFSNGVPIGEAESV